MIGFEEAYKLVLTNCRDYGTESVGIKAALGRILAEDVTADRDFPPFDRATKDGIALHFSAVEKGQTNFKVSGLLGAGMPPVSPDSKTDCIEIMTGAVVPNDADTVIMYEDLIIKDGSASIQRKPTQGANIHIKGSDIEKGAAVLHKNTRITPAAIGVMASVGKARVKVKKLPRISVISSGKELVEIEKNPLPFQVRRSNAYSLFAALKQEMIMPLLLHLDDDKDIIRQKLYYAMQEMDVLLLSGGVSQGKFDYIPQVLNELGAKTIFHKVKQRPGKPFWFGTHKMSETVIFSFPGNPVSTFLNYHLYFKPWLARSLGLSVAENNVILNEDIHEESEFTLFRGARINMDSGKITATLVSANGSGDLISLAKSDGFVRINPQKKCIKKGTPVPFITTRNIF
jgi:molybdopterin molybdotransferase